MKSRAFHRLRRADGSIVEGPVVVQTDVDGRLLSWHLLQSEEANTEWVGGTYEEGDY